MESYTKYLMTSIYRMYKNCLLLVSQYYNRDIFESVKYRNRTWKIVLQEMGAHTTSQHTHSQMHP